MKDNLDTLIDDNPGMTLFMEDYIKKKNLQKLKDMSENRLMRMNPRNCYTEEQLAREIKNEGKDAITLQHKLGYKKHQNINDFFL